MRIISKVYERFIPKSSTLVSKSFQCPAVVAWSNGKVNKFLGNGSFDGIALTDLPKALGCIDRNLFIADSHVNGTCTFTNMFLANSADITPDASGY